MVTTTQVQQQLIGAGVGVSVEGAAGVEMMVMESLDPTLLQMKTEVSSQFQALYLTWAQECLICADITQGVEIKWLWTVPVLLHLKYNVTPLKMKLISRL